MTAIKVNARDLIIEVETSTTDTFVAIDPDGITGITINPGENEEVADTTTYGSEGNYEQEVMQRGATIELSGRLLKDPDTGALDPGQARCEVLGVAVGTGSVGRIRFRHPTDTSWKIWRCTVTLGEQGGETNDKSAWGVTFTRSGASTTATVA